MIFKEKPRPAVSRNARFTAASSRAPSRGWTNSRHDGLSPSPFFLDELIIGRPPSETPRQVFLQDSDDVHVEVIHPRSGELFIASDRMEVGLQPYRLNRASTFSCFPDALITQADVEEEERCMRRQARQEKRFRGNAKPFPLRARLDQGMEIRVEVDFVGEIRVQAARIRPGRFLSPRNGGCPQPRSGRRPAAWPG